MNGVEPRLRTLVAWLLPLALLTGVIGWETNWGRASSSLPIADVAPKPQPVTVALLPEYLPDSAAAGTREMVSRTLFNPTRRPAPVAVVETAKPKMQRGQFALAGTTVVEGKATAFLRETKGGKPRRVVQGETIDGLLVADVKADRVRLTMGDEAEELLLKVATNPRPTPQPPQPALPQVAAGRAVPGAAGSAIPAAAGSAVPGAPSPQAGTPAAPEVSRILAERRRAAREAQANEGAPPPDGSNRVPLVAPAAPAAAGANPPAAPPPDARWQQIYQQYQQRNR